MSARKIVSQRIEVVRKKRNLSQPAFAEALGMEGTKGRSTVNNWEQGAIQIKSDDLALICKTFGVSADYLLGLSESPTLKENLKIAEKTTGLSPTAINELRKNPIVADYMSDLITNFGYGLSLELHNLKEVTYSAQSELESIKARQSVPEFAAKVESMMSSVNLAQFSFEKYCRVIPSMYGLSEFEQELESFVVDTINKLNVNGGGDDGERG